jgi:ABC-2 type transport system ATP-binding protein
MTSINRAGGRIPEAQWRRKSTTMKLLTGYLALRQASAASPATTCRPTGKGAGSSSVTSQKTGPLYPDMSPRSLLRFLARPAVDGVRSIGGWRRSLRLATEAVIGKPTGKLSRATANAWAWPRQPLHDPEVLILDEPTAGLDPNQILEVRRMIRELGQTKTILLSTHILQEVEAMCNRVIFINEGRIVFDGTPSELAVDPAQFAARFHELTRGARPENDLAPERRGTQKKRSLGENRLELGEPCGN